MPAELEASATVIQVSDTHLSARHGWFVANWRKAVDRIASRLVDLVVNSGDLSINGAVEEPDLRFARSEHERLGTAWRTVPGNHDVGEEPDALHVGQPIGSTSVNRYRRIFGEDRWTFDIAGWRLVGINSLLLGSALGEETEQQSWLSDQLHRSDRPVGLFLHKPLFIGDPADASPTTRAVLPQARADLLKLIARSPVRFVASGHLHRPAINDWNGVTVVWAPSTAFPANFSEERAPLGWVEHHLSPKGHTARVVELPELQRFDLDELKGHGRFRFLHQTPDCPSDLR